MVYISIDSLRVILIIQVFSKCLFKISLIFLFKISFYYFIKTYLTYYADRFTDHLGMIRDRLIPMITKNVFDDSHKITFQQNVLEAIILSGLKKIRIYIISYNIKRARRKAGLSG